MSRLKPVKRPFHHGDLRNALIFAAKELIEREGFERFALREAARTVGVSANAAYHHFADKEALLVAVALSGFAELAAERELAREKVGADAWKQLSAGAKAYVRFAERRPKLFDLMFGAIGQGSDQTSSGTEPKGHRTYEQLSDALDRLVSSGRLTPERRAGAENVLWPIVHGLAVLRRAGALREEFDESWKRIENFTAEALRIDSLRNEEVGTDAHVTTHRRPRRSSS